MAEDVAAEIARVLRPGGQLLACVDSLVLGMSILAEQHHWAELTDLPQAEVVLMPWPDGRITRCFGPEQLIDLLTEAGWRSAGSGRAPCCPRPWWITCCARTPSAIMRLVRAELAAGAEDGPTGARPAAGRIVRHLPAGRGAQARLNRVSDICRLHMSDTAGWSQRRRPVPLRLAVHAPGRLRAGLQPAFRDRPPQSAHFP